MLRLPTRSAALILSLAPPFSGRGRRHAEVFLLGAVLAPGKRTVTSLLRVTGLARERRFGNYHRVLSRAAWSSRAASRLPPDRLIEALAPSGPVVLGIDDAIERRRGERIAAKGLYRDPVRSSRGHFVKASGLRRISPMLLAPVPWAGRVWALPFPTAPAPSERYCRVRGLRHKKLTDRARQPVVQARRRLPGRDLVVVGDTGSAWYREPSPTFRDTLAAVRRHVWREQGLLASRRGAHSAEPRPALQRAPAHAICHAARWPESG